MKLTNEQAAKLKTFLMRKRPCIVRQDERASLRIEGETGDGDWDALGYRSVVAVIQRGLGDQADVVRQVLGIAAKVQNDNNLNYPVLLFSFGWDDGVLHGKGRSRNGGPNIRCDGWVQELCELALTDTGPVPQTIPSLFQPAVSRGVPLKVRGEDLLIFFCRDRSVSMTKEARAHYAKPLKHAVWIYCEEDTVDVGFGTRSDELSTSRPGAYTTIVSKRNTGETAYQRAIIAGGCHRLMDLGQVAWLDIELPIIFGKSSRRRSLDLIGRDENNRLVLCELKYDKPEKTLIHNRKPATDNPAYALREILDYSAHAIENASRLHDCHVCHTNRRGDWKWKECERLDNSVLIVAANRTYWDNWQGYNPKCGKGGWQEIKNEIADIVSMLPQKQVIKFYATPDSDFDIQATSETNQGLGYSPKPLVGDWHEVALS